MREEGEEEEEEAILTPSSLPLSLPSVQRALTLALGYRACEQTERRGGTHLRCRGLDILGFSSFVWEMD